MPLYRVHFTLDAAEPLPPVADLPEVEALSPFAAAKAVLAAGRVPQVPGLKWARVVVAYQDDGTPSQIMRFRFTPSRADGLELLSQVAGCMLAAFRWPGCFVCR